MKRVWEHVVGTGDETVNNNQGKGKYKDNGLDADLGSIRTTEERRVLVEGGGPPRERLIIPRLHRFSCSRLPTLPPDTLLVQQRVGVQLCYRQRVESASVHKPAEAALAPFHVRLAINAQGGARPPTPVVPLAGIQRPVRAWDGRNAECIRVRMKAKQLLLQARCREHIEMD